MRLPLIMMIAVILISIGIDWLIYRYLRSCKSQYLRKVHTWTMVALYAIIVFVVVVVSLRIDSDNLFRDIMWLLYTYFATYISKLLFVLSVSVGWLPRLWHGRRWKSPSVIGSIIALAVFGGMMWGTVNRYRSQIVELDIEFDNLPEEFDGYRLAQFSDFHVGSYRDTIYVAEIVDLLNGLDVDMIAFTGDIVNRKTAELEPFVAPLSRLNAPDGVFSILGNHDYGDYSSWKSPQAKEANMQRLYQLQDSMDWRLLLNETVFLHRGNDSIALIGVENVGDPPFKVYGDLRKAYPSLSDPVSKLLLTHNPAHWTQEIADNDSVNVDLSLSGHTHAMQIELDIFGHRYSPSAFRYDTWGGLYMDKDSQHKLYVNIGLGTVAIPARIGGATPEITIITLRKSK